MTSSMCDEDVMTSSGFYPGLQDTSLYDHNKSQSSSEELLSSTPGSSSAALLPPRQQSASSSAEELLSSTPGSRSNSLERILENQRLLAAAENQANRSRSSSRGDRSSPMKSSFEQKTPDTDTSDTSLPPPPPALLDPTLTQSPAVLKPQPKPRGSPPQGNNGEQEGLPLGHLRDSLRKTKTHPGSGARRSRELEDADTPGDSSPNVASLDSSNAKQVISRYGTIPKGARIGAFLASLQSDSNNADSSTNSIKDQTLLESPVKSPELEQRFRDKSRLVDNRDTVSLSNYPQMPTPEVKRKVEEWRAGVERSMTEPEKPKIPYEKPKYSKPILNNTEENKGPERNVKPSSLRSSNSTHAMPATEKEKTFLTRQKSDLTGIKSSTSGNGGSSQTSPVTESTVTSDTSSSTITKAPSPVPDWRRRTTKPTPSPRAVPHRFASEDSPVSSSPPKAFQRPDTDDFQNVLARKLSPPVPKKVIANPEPRSETPPPKGSKPRMERLDSAPSGNSSIDGSTDSLLDSAKQKPTRSSFSEKIGFLRGSKREKDADGNKVKKEKKGFFNKQGSSDKVDKSADKGKFSERVYAKPSPKLPQKPASEEKDEEKTPPFGGRAMFPGGKPMLPGGASGAAAVISSPKQLQRMSLHHVDIEREKTQDEDEPVSKETVLSASKSLKASLDNLNSRKSKHTSNFMHLSEEVQSFYNTCSSYVEGLPPHGKFHFRELLNTLQNVAESLKTCSGSNAKDYDRLLTELHNSIKEIINGVSKR